MTDEMYPAAQDEAQEGETGKHDEASEKDSFLAPKRLFPDAQPGDTVSLRVAHIYGSEVELAPAGEDDSQDEGEGEEGEPPEESEMSRAMGRMDMMGGE